MTRSLTDKQAAFVNEYAIDFCAKQSAIRSGYSPKTAEQQGWQLLQNPLVIEALAAKRSELAVRTELTRDEVIEGLLAEARNVGEGSSHSARVSAWAHLGKHLGLFDQDQEKGREIVIQFNSLHAGVL